MSVLSSAFSAVMLVGQAVAAPADMQMIEQPISVIQPAKQAFENQHLQECMLERRRWLYEARTNTLIMSNIASAAHQEVAMGPRFS